MSTLETRLVKDVFFDEQDKQRVAIAHNIPVSTQMTAVLYEVRLDGSTYYCCCSGGELRDGTPYLTPIGTAAFNALMKLPRANAAPAVVQELQLGPTPLIDKMKHALKRAGPGGFVCFLGDMAGALDPHIARIFRLVGTVDVADLVIAAAARGKPPAKP